MKTAIVTGSGGLIGSSASKFLLGKGYRVVGIDNDMRAYFFGKEASTEPAQKSLAADANFEAVKADIREIAVLQSIFRRHRPEIVIHTAAQPSHDWAAREPLTDFSINAEGTVNLLEMTRLHSPEATFVFTSTNKVYGDNPNSLDIIELERRYEKSDYGSIDEKMSLDHTTHSVFGASKVAADIMVQEYGRYFGMKTVVFRGGCLTGPSHAGAELHGFLSYLVKCMVHRKPYTIIGYKGKQVRDNIHSDDLIEMFWKYHLNPRPGAVYNAGGGRENSTSILEAIDSINSILLEHGRPEWDLYTFSPENRIGDHIWYISDLTKFRHDYPEWEMRHSLDSILREMVKNEMK